MNKAVEFVQAKVDEFGRRVFGREIRVGEVTEKQVEDNGDPLITRRIGGREYKLRKSVWKVIDERTKEKLEEKIESLERVMSEEEYLKLLYKYREWLEAGGGRWREY